MNNWYRRIFLSVVLVGVLAGCVTTTNRAPVNTDAAHDKRVELGMKYLEAGKRDNADGNFFYGRRGAPTQWALADALTELEPGAEGTVLYPSGVAAIAGALLAVLEAGDVLLMTDNAYEPSRTMAKTLLAPLGIETRFFDPLDLDGFAEP